MRSKPTCFRIGTRASKLALAQTNLAIEYLKKQGIDFNYQIKTIRTHGDLDQLTPLHKMKVSGSFVSTIQQALFDKRIDGAIHSLKDLPSQDSDGLTTIILDMPIDPFDGLISKHHIDFEALPYGCTIASSSLRRQACIHHKRKDIHFIDMRGNIDTRLTKLNNDPTIDAIILATAGLNRIDKKDVITQVLDPSWMIPACGQGALAFQCRCEDVEWFEPLISMVHTKTYDGCIMARRFLQQTKAGCHQPVGFYAMYDHNHWHIDAMVGTTIENCRFIHIDTDEHDLDQIVSRTVKRLEERS